MPRARIAAAFVLFAPPFVLGQVLAGPEFQVNSHIADYQMDPSPAIRRDGGFVVVWTSSPFCPFPPPIPPPPCNPAQDGSGAGVFGQRFAAGGAREGAEFRVNVTVGGSQERPALATLSDGRLGTWWQHLGNEVRGRFHDPSGTPVGNEFTVAPGDFPDVASQPDGGFVVVWRSAPATLRGRRFTSDGVGLGSAFDVGTSAGATPFVASDAFGRFVVTWNQVDGSSGGTAARHFAATGVPSGPAFVVNAYTTGHQGAPRVAAYPAGDFVITWSDLERRGIFARRFDSAASPAGNDFRVDDVTTTFPQEPVVAIGDHGEMLVAWRGAPVNALFRMAARRYDRAGVPGPQLFLDSNTVTDRFHPSIAFDEAGNAVAAWTSTNHQDGSRSGVFARRLGGLRPTALDVDVAAGPSSDGNRVLEPGEAVTVVPSWRNATGGLQSFSGVASAFGGPGTPPYLLLDGTGDYGAVPDGSTAACGAQCYQMAVGAPAVRPAPHWDAQFLEDIQPPSHGQAKAWLLHVGDTYPDVPRTSPFYRFVETVTHHSVMPGCSASHFCPTLGVGRNEMAVFLLLAREPGVLPPACVAGQERCADGPAGDGYCRWIEELARRNVVTGCGGGNYCPTLSVTREQLAVYLLATREGAAYAPPPCAVPMFGDMPASSPFCRWIEELARRGVVTGCGGGNYCPTLGVSREQMTVFLSVTFGLTLYGP